MGHLKKKKFVVLYICMLFIVTGFGFRGGSFTSPRSDEEIIMKTFKISDAQFQKLTVTGWELIECKDYSGDLQELLKQRAAGLFPGGFTLSRQRGEKANSITIRGRIARDITASVTLAAHMGTVIQNREAYLILALESSNQDSYSLMEKIHNKILKDKTNKSIVIQGYIDKNLSPPEKNRVLGRMIKSAAIQNVDTMAEQSMVSVSGYSPNVRNVLTPDSKWVNINMALRYNSLDKRTFVYVGSPVITIEY